jgi:hypothetical protein
MDEALMNTSYATAQELIRQLPTILLETGDKRIDYLASAALAEIARDLRDGRLTHGNEISGRLEELEEELSQWMGRHRSPRVTRLAQRVIDLCGQFNAEFNDSKSLPV